MKMHWKNLIPFIVIFTTTFANATGPSIDTRMPLVEQTLRFLKSQALSPPAEARLLRAGVIRVCGAKLERPGCLPHGLPVPSENDTSPDAMQIWRRILESTLATEAIRQGDTFDRIAFQRYIMDAMVEELNDPGSFYLAPSVYEKIANIPKDFVGFGFRVISKKNHLCISAVYPGSPASIAGLKLGDNISKVNDLPVVGYYRPMALAAIWGADGEQIGLELQKENGIEQSKQTVLNVTYAPWTYKAHSFSTNDNKIVIARIRYFAHGLTEKLTRALTKNTLGLILDLRDAASGDEMEMVSLADVFIKDGDIGSKKARTDLGTQSWTAKANSPEEQLKLPIVVVTNQATSGLAEVLIAALRHHKRALLIGQTSSGNVTRETLMPFSDGSAIQVTSTRLLGPNKSRLTAGIAPHVSSDSAKIVSYAERILRNTSGPSLDRLLQTSKKVTPLQ